MKSLPESERPYEKAAEYGVESLSDAELLAVILRTGTKDKSVRELAEEILKLGNPSGLPGLLHHSLADYQEIRGIGSVKAVQLSCIGELSKRIWKSAKVTSELICRNPAVIAEYFMEEMRHKEQEFLKMLILNTKNILIVLKKKLYACVPALLICMSGKLQIRQCIWRSSAFSKMNVLKKFTKIICQN